jgi:hypothetical protein
MNSTDIDVKNGTAPLWCRDILIMEGSTDMITMGCRAPDDLNNYDP